jgi:ketosteroid isomerase-like protein
MRNASIVVAMMLVTPALGQDKATIEKMNESFATAFNKGDTATVAQMYVEDAYLLPAGSPMVRGRRLDSDFLDESGRECRRHEADHRGREAAWDRCRA